ncbi:MAG: sigma-70 family RNA polymerase sigma factor [Thalassobaculum sp.]|uniref:sigma-70 family RNA polymerase sigma factor n=1 Tax=Thalassobaculum sp. TaxID=2022740 RepID=UPI0032EBF552
MDRSQAEGQAELDETELVARLKAGDERAFEMLVRRETGRLLAAARRLVRDEAAAYDCVQEAFLSAYKAIDGFEPRSSVGAWLHRITINAALMRLRKERRLAETSIDDLLPSFDSDGWRRDLVEVPAGDPESELERRRIREFVRSKIDVLPEGYRTALVLRDLEGWSTREAAEALGIAEGAMKVRLHRARAALKRLIEPLWTGDVSA